MPETQRQKHKIATRKHIIETAIEAYAQNGLLKTTTSAIAKAAKVSHGTIFTHFPTQEKLLTAVIEEFGSRINERLHELVSCTIGVQGILRAHIKGLMEFELFYTRLVMEGPLLPAEAKNTLIMIQSAISFHLSQAAALEMQTGTILHLPVHLLFNGWIGLIHYYLANNELFAPNESVLKRYGDELLHYYTSLIMPKP